ncbi:mppB [Symbiodinium sp. KB8]|nr:mppB [Symbiodinium sp. KB8]
MATLNNGVRVATEGGHGETATVGVYIDAGSRDETERNNGVAHFLEHLNFKGTGKRSQTSLEMEFENMGGHLNAYTSREQTVYFAKVFKKDVPKAVELLADILQNSEYDSDAVNRERGVILREMEEVSKQQEEVIFDRLHETAYQGTGLGRTILGPVQNIQSITRDDLTSFVKNNYTGPRVVIAGAGAVEHQQLVDLGEKHFGKLPKVGESSVSRLSDKAVFTGSEIRHREDTIPFVHTTVAFETGGWTDPDSIPLMVMQTLLGNFDR